jgi:hypothetical protein
MAMDIPTEVPTFLKIMVSVVSIVTLILMGWLVVRIYRNEARNEDDTPRNKGW